MKISVIVPFYNREKTAERCLNSLLASTYENIEILAVDDGSSDKTVEILRSFAEQDNRVKVICQENSGPSAARNRGLDSATGELVAFCDSDDFVAPTIYERMMEAQKENNADIVICGFFDNFENGNNILHKIAAKNSISQSEVRSNVIRHYYDGDPTGLASLWNKLYKKAFLDQNALRFDESLHRAEDWWLNLHAYECANRITVIDEPLYYYVQDAGDSLMKKMKSEYYWQWKASNAYLVQKNTECYHFEIDNDRFYREQLFTIHSLLLSMSSSSESLDTILADDYYNRIIQYDKLTSAPVKLCHRLHKISKSLEKLAYKCLAVYYRRGK